MQTESGAVYRRNAGTASAQDISTSYKAHQHWTSRHSSLVSLLQARSQQQLPPAMQSNSAVRRSTVTHTPMTDAPVQVQPTSSSMTTSVTNLDLTFVRVMTNDYALIFTRFYFVFFSNRNYFLQFKDRDIFFRRDDISSISSDISLSLNKGPRRQIEKIRYKGLIRRADALDRRIERSATVQTFFHTLFRLSK